MESILDEICEWFLKKELALRVFAEHDSRVEGWFKGEMLVCLEVLRHRGRLEQCEREYSVGGRRWGEKGQEKIDIRIRLNGADHLCELKALCISQAYGTGRNLDFYFRPKSEVGLPKDFRKLEAIPCESPRWVLAFVYPNPGRDKWQKTLKKWADEIRRWSCLTSPETYAEWLFIALWGMRKP